MRTTRRFTGEYATDGKQKRLKVREEAGHRCIRCNHPFESGKHGKGEWSPCDEHCTHGGPIRIVVKELPDTIGRWKEVDGFQGTVQFYRSGSSEVQAKWRILTVHHLDGNKSNDAWWNTLALCQRCHLQIQGKVDPNTPWMLEHSEWFKPYVAGFYAHKYEGRDITREETEQRMDELLAYEFKG